MAGVRMTSTPRRGFRWLPVFAVWLAATVGAEEAAMENVVLREGAYELAEGPRVGGVFLLHQGAWPESVIRAFRRTPWLDGASVRIKWSELEPRDGVFDWSPFDRVLDEVRRYNRETPGAARTLQVRILGGEHCPRWFEEAGVRFYDTRVRTASTPRTRLHIPVPYDNPEFLDRLRGAYRALVDHYRDTPEVTVFHGTWSAGPWDEIFHPQGDAPLPPNYTPERFVEGMVRQLDVLIEEICLQGKVGELPFSGLYPPRREIDITGPLVRRAVERLGKRSPYLYIQSNGWGVKSRGPDTGSHTLSWGHEDDLNHAYGQVNLAVQAIGTNAGGGWIPQGDWVGNVRLALRYEAAYAEIYPPDVMPLDNDNRIVAAFTQEPGAAGEGTIPDFTGFRSAAESLKRAPRVPEGRLVLRFAAPGGQPRRPLPPERAVAAPAGTSVAIRCRTRQAGGEWSPFRPAESAAELPPGDEIEIEAVLRTDDGALTPRIAHLSPAWAWR